MVDAVFEKMDDDFNKALRHNIVQRWLYCYGILELNKVKTLRRRLIITMGTNIIELKLPTNTMNLMNFERYRYVTAPLIKTFKSKIAYLKEKGTLNNFTEPGNSIQNFLTEQLFETIQYQLKEGGKNQSIILYTGMTN